MVIEYNSNKSSNKCQCQYSINYSTKLNKENIFQFIFNVTVTLIPKPHKEVVNKKSNKPISNFPYEHVCKNTQNTCTLNPRTH